LAEFHIDYGPNLVLVLTGSFPNTASAIFFQGMDTGSTYPISASWALQVVSASLTNSASYTLTASYALNSSTTTQLNSTNPTYKISATASIPTSTVTSQDVLTAVWFTSSNARADGGDIRVQAAISGSPNGPYLPISVAVTAQSGSYLTYQVFWTDTYISNSAKEYVITYGDPLGNYMYLNQSQFAVIKKRGMLQGNYVVYPDNAQADSYSDANWGTIGVRLSAMTGLDDGTVQFATPQSYFYNGATQVSFSVSTNGQFRYGNVAFSGYGLAAPDQWGMNYGDNRQVWCDVVTNVDGWALQYYNQHNLGQAGSYFKAVMRYRNNGKFVLSIFDTSPAHQANYATNYINGYAASNFWGYTFSGVITGSNPLSAVAIVIEPLATAGLSGSEVPF
jgi:hypothetical protein